MILFFIIIIFSPALGFACCYSLMIGFIHLIYFVFKAMIFILKETSKLFAGCITRASFVVCWEGIAISKIKFFEMIIKNLLSRSHASFKKLVVLHLSVTLHL